MPVRLLKRRRTDSVREFRASARQQFQDGLALAAAGRRTGAIYVWGYCAEMLLKAAYFSVTGVAESVPITWQHLSQAITRGITGFQILWPNVEKGHSVRA